MRLAYLFAFSVLAVGCAHVDLMREPAKPVPLPGTGQALGNILTYEFGQPREPLRVVEDLVRDAADHPGERLLLARQLSDVLGTEATDDCKRFVFRQLAIIGDQRNVHAIAPHLVDPALSDMARYAIESMRGMRVNTVLIRALNEGPDEVKVGLINSLAKRDADRALKSIAALKDHPDPEIAAAAIAALDRM